MAKVLRSVRLEAGTFEAVDAWAKEHGTGKGEAMERLIRAGIDATSGNQTTAGATDADDGANIHTSDQGAVIEALRASNADLREALVGTRAVVSTLTAQLATKDEQIARAHDLAEHAQQLHAIETTKALPAPRRSWLERLGIRRKDGTD